MLGEERNSLLRINVPDLNVSLRLEDPFKTQELSTTLARAAEGNEEALAKVVSDETGAANAIVARCIDMLKQSHNGLTCLPHGQSTNVLPGVEAL